MENIVFFNDEVGNPDYDEEGMKDLLFEAAHNDRQAGNPTRYYLTNPALIREKKYQLDIEILPERVKDTQLQMIQMWDEITQLLNTFGRSTQGGMVDMEELKKTYLEVSGKPDKLFTNEAMLQLEQAEAGQAKMAEQEKAEAYNMGSFGKPATPQPQDPAQGMQPKIKEAARQQ
jgi:hypothetical protein